MIYSTERPAYVGQSWLKHTTGFMFVSATPSQLASDTYLLSPNLWERIVCITLQAQAGNFRNVNRLIDTVHLTKDVHVGTAAVRVYCHIAPRKALCALESVFSHSDYDVRVESYTGAALTCDLSVVNLLLSAMPSRVGDERNYVATALSDLLDPARDDEAELIELVDDVEAFTRMARKMAKDYVVQFGADTALLRGAPLDIRHLVRVITELCRREDHVDMGGDIDDLLSIFEAMTGISCAGCSTDDVAPVVPKIASVLNQFRTKGPPDQFKIGRRYFFGHEIPPE